MTTSTPSDNPQRSELRRQIMLLVIDAQFAPGSGSAINSTDQIMQLISTHDAKLKERLMEEIPERFELGNRLTDTPQHYGDQGYNNAIRDCTEAIEDVFKKMEDQKI